MSTKKPRSFGPTKILERAYADGLRQVARRVLPPRLSEQTVDEWLAEIAARSQAKEVVSASELLATRMVHWVSVHNARTWREAAAKSQRSRWLYARLQEEMKGTLGPRVRALVQQNAMLIRTLPLEAATRLTEEVLRAQQGGARPATIAKMSRARFPALLRSRVNLISRTETAKASTALTEARCAELDVEWYEWLTSEDTRVRPSHKNLDHVLIPWAHAPDPEALVGENSSLGHYHSGACPNCRCTQRVMLSVHDVTWPHRVYWDGVVRQMTKQAFLKKFAGKLKEAA